MRKDFLPLDFQAFKNKLPHVWKSELLSELGGYQDYLLRCKRINNATLIKIDYLKEDLPENLPQLEEKSITRLVINSSSNEIPTLHHVTKYDRKSENHLKEIVFTSDTKFKKEKHKIYYLISPHQYEDVNLAKEDIIGMVPNRSIGLLPHLNHTKQALKKLMKPAFRNHEAFFVLPLTSHFYYNIAYVRAMKLLLQHNFTFEHPFLYAETSVVNEDKILAIPMQVLAAKLGGVEFVYIDEIDPREQYYYNIIPILEEESRLQEWYDIALGSYFLESLTKQIYDNVFDELILDINSSFHPKFKKQRFYETGSISTPTLEKKKLSYFPEDMYSGTPPFIRGPYTSMYTGRPWTIRQYAGFSDAKASNEFYLENLRNGQKGLSVAFDLPTHRGYDSDAEIVKADVGKAGVAIDSIEDMHVLFDQIPLNKMSVSMTMNGAVLPVLAFYIATAIEKGVDKHHLKGTIQNDILKEFIVRNTYIYPPEASMRIISDIFKYTTEHMPKYNSISVSGYHMHEAGADAATELAFTIANGLEYVRTGIEAGIEVDDFAPRLSFFWGIGMNIIDEIAKLRAGRALWALVMKQFNPKNPKSMCLRAHCQTSGYSLTRQNPKNNIIRTLFEAFSAIAGQTQSLHTNAFDEAIALPSKQSAKIARDTQLFLQKHNGLTDVIDPFGGSFVIEQKTDELIKKAYQMIEDIENMGGMLAAVKQNYPQRIISEQAAIKQARLDSDQDIIIGVNKLHYEDGFSFEIVEIDNEEVKKQQVEKINALKSSRDQHRVNEILHKLKKATESKTDNLLEIVVEAALARATLGEISMALEEKYGRFKPTFNIVSGLYKSISMDKATIQSLIEKCENFEQQNGRRPRILMAKIGQDGHDRGYKIVASALADFGFDVDLGSLFQTAKQVARQAINNDVHFIGVSTQAGAHKPLLKELIEILKEEDSADIKIVAGGIIPEQDIPYLKEIGVWNVFGPGTPITNAAEQMLQLLNQKE